MRSRLGEDAATLGVEKWGDCSRGNWIGFSWANAREFPRDLFISSSSPDNRLAFAGLRLGCFQRYMRLIMQIVTTIMISTATHSATEMATTAALLSFCGLFPGGKLPRVGCRLVWEDATRADTVDGNDVIFGWGEVVVGSEVASGWGEFVVGSGVASGLGEFVVRSEVASGLGEFVVRSEVASGLGEFVVRSEVASGWGEVVVGSGVASVGKSHIFVSHM